MADDFEARLQAAYAAGDADLILKLVSGQADEPDVVEERPGQAGLDPNASEFVMPSRASEPAEAPDDGDGDGDSSSNADDNDDDEGVGLAALRDVFSHADPGVVQALLLAHGGDVDAAEVSLRELDACGALASEGDPRGCPGRHFDADGYAAAVEEWESEFPSLAGPKPAREARIVSQSSKRGSVNLYNEGRLLWSVRERSLVESFPWISRDEVARVFRDCGGVSASASRRLLAQYPKPDDWDSKVAEKAQEAIRQAISRATESLRRNAYDDDLLEDGSARTNTKKWVRTGDAVAQLYTEKRQDATNEARQRNKYFERAAQAARAGNSAEASRLGALGRASNNKMKELHRAAADLLWEEQNPSYVAEGQIDLHGLHVSEALERLPEALEVASATRSRINVIFGTGHHTRGGGGAPRLRPAVLQFLQTAGYAWGEIADAQTNQVGAVSVRLS